MRIKKLVPFYALALLALLLSLAPRAPAQIVVIQGTDTIAASRATINNNFAYLDQAKTGRFSGAGAPGIISLSRLGDIYSNTTDNTSYQCFAPSGNCTAVAVGNWQAFTGSGGVLTFTVAGTSGQISVAGTCTVTTTGTCTLSLPSTITGVTTMPGLVSVSTITTGVWNATAVGILYGGTGATTQSAAATNILPPATLAGSLAYWTGTAWAIFAGNNSGTKFLQEDPSGALSWASVAGSGTVTSATIAGTANKITASGTCTITTTGTCTLDLPWLTATTGTFTLTNAKTLSVSNTITFTATDGSTAAFGAGGTVLYGGTDFTFSSGSHTLSGGASSILDTSAGKFLLPTANTAGTGITISTVSGTSQISFNSAVLSGVYATLAGPNTFAQLGTCTSTATVGCFGMTATTIPSALASGYWNYGTDGRYSWFDSTNIQYIPSVVGSVRVAPTAPTSGRCALWGATFTLTEDSDCSFSGTTLTVTDIVASTSLTVNGGAITNNVVQNSRSAAYTTVLSDAGKHILHPTADNNARTFTIDSNANVAYPVGTVITFVNQINTVTIAITSDTLVLAGAGTTGSRTLAANGIATAMKIATTTWIINGSGLT